MEQNKNLSAQKIIEQLDALLRQNNYAAAKEHLIYCKTQASLLNDDKTLLLIYNELMGLCRKLGEKDQAINYATSALLQIEKMQIENNVGAATTYLNCGTVYKAFGMADKGIDLFLKAKKIYEENLKPDDERISGLYNNMALALVDLKRFDDALALYKKAILNLQNKPNKQPEQAITYLNMASLKEAQYGLEEADGIINEYIKKAMELLDIAQNRTDGEYAFACEKCATVFGYYGYFDYENKLKERCRRIYEGT